jgi:hypothetical protein
MWNVFPMPLKARQEPGSNHDFLVGETFDPNPFDDGSKL